MYQYFSRSYILQIEKKISFISILTVRMNGSWISMRSACTIDLLRQVFSVQ